MQIKKITIGILGTRGIPNNYGGFEQVAGYLAQGLVSKGHSVFVYNSHDHSYKNNTWQGVNIIHKYNPERWTGPVGQFLYDLKCILDSRRRQFDIILILGYTSSSIWGKLYPKKSKIIINMDGLEWKRSKYSRIVRLFLKKAEMWGVKFSHAQIADSLVIQKYLDEKYNINSIYIPYGASIQKEGSFILSKYNLQKQKYFLLIARMEPENNIEMIIDGFSRSNSSLPLLIVGKMENSYAKKLILKYKDSMRIIFAGGIYNCSDLYMLRNNCAVYFHGHSVGGTNPSLLEAMAAKCLIASHNNPFNRQVLGNDALYFNNFLQVKQIIENDISQLSHLDKMENNYSKILSEYNWPLIVDKYESFFNSVI